MKEGSGAIMTGENRDPEQTPLVELGAQEL